MAGGVPIGAFLVREHLASALAPGTHGTTFGGNPLACAAALAVLRTIDEEGLMGHAERMGAHLLAGLDVLVKRHPHAATGARGRGLLVGLVLADGVDPRGVLNAMRERGVLVSQAGDRVIRFAPPLIVTAASSTRASPPSTPSSPTPPAPPPRSDRHAHLQDTQARLPHGGRPGRR